MKDVDPTKDELIQEIADLRDRIASLQETNKKQCAIEKKLMDEERFLYSVFTSVQDGISVLDKDLNIIMVNHKIEEWYEHAIPLVGKKCFAVYQGRSQPCEICPTMKTLETGQAAHEYVPRQGGRGETVGWLDLYSFPLVDQETGKTRGVIEYVRDISDQKKVEDALRESEEKYRTLIEHANDGVTILQDNIVKFLNPRLAAMYGEKAENIVNKLFVNFVHPSEQPRLVELYTKRMSGLSIPDIYETTLIDKEGNKVFVEINATRILYSGRPADLVVIRDVGERKKAEEKLKHQHDLINRMMETSPIGITMVDRKGLIVFANPQAERILGLTKDKIKDRTYNDPAWRISNFHGNPVPDEDLPFTRVVRMKQPVYDVRHAIEYPDGRRILLSINGAPLLDENGEIDAVVFALSDITQRLQTEESLRKSEEKFRITAQSTSDLIWEWDIPNERLDWFGDVDGVLGYRAGEFSRTIQAWEAIVHPDDHDRVMAGLNRHLKDRTPYVEEYRVVRKNMELRWWVDRGSALRDKNGKPYKMYGACTDITEYMNTQAALTTSNEKLRRAMEGTINALANTLEKRDPYTLHHQQRVTELVVAIAKKMGLAEEQLNGIRTAATLHDIGKIYVPSEILSKPARLSEAEFSIVKIHARAGYEILQSIDFGWPVAQVILQHHERLDGSGYPSGIKDREILLEAKILAVADVVEAMTSHRPYRSANSLEKALDEITRNRDILYNDEVVNICLRLFQEDGFHFSIT
jgi:PAS domain S-box-containing protein/putative nucleotidyltransferase with HDIG domain